MKRKEKEKKKKRKRKGKEKEKRKEKEKEKKDPAPPPPQHILQFPQYPTEGEPPGSPTTLLRPRPPPAWAAPAASGSQDWQQTW